MADLSSYSPPAAIVLHAPTQAPEAELIDYVRSCARLMELALADDQIGRVAMHLSRTRALAALLHGFELHAEVDPAEVYSPAPFPAAESGDASA